MAGRALRAWGDAVAGSVDELARGMGGLKPPTLAEGAARLQPIPRASVHAAGWELRHALAWRNDDRCIQRAMFAALSLAERETGGIAPAVGRLAVDDAMPAAMAVAYDPKFGNVRFHAAAVARTLDDELVVIDHLFAGTDDGVMAIGDWLRRTGASEAQTTIVSPLRQPPWSLRAGPGIPANARANGGESWRQHAGHLARSWQEAAERRLPQVVPVT
jgi:hypothetical protein